MDTFNFTKKKFLSLSKQVRRRHLIKWLTTTYQTITTNRTDQNFYDFFSQQYKQALEWAELSPFKPPETNQPRLWLETISDQIHRHRSALKLSPRDHDLILKVTTLDQEKPSATTPFDCHVALDGLRSLFNVGSIIRTSEAAGFASVILANIPDIHHPGLKKTAMGAQDWIHIESTNDLFSWLVEKKEAGYLIIGVETIKEALPVNQIQWQERTILVFGNEEYGISSHVMAACDHFVSIPMYGRKNSLNVANAVSVICFQAALALKASRASEHFEIKNEIGSRID